ncbi:hypothetical protein B566_EDAN006489 [Ephemera danica]|nr:hypothetical protein B566_EDAN006489 [Ephemera danica]
MKAVGRSRGYSGTPDRPLRRPGESLKSPTESGHRSNHNIQDVMVDSLMEDLQSITLDDKAQASKQLRVIEESFRDFVRNEQKLKLVIRALHDRSLDNRQFGARAARLCGALYMFETDGVPLRREELRAEGLESLINAIELVGHALNHIHLPDGSRVKILGFALFDYMLELLEDSNEGLLRAFTVQFSMSGSVLQEMFPSKFDELMLRVRSRLASGGFKRESTSYWLLLALDLENKNWELFPESLAMFYCKRLGKNNVVQLQSANFSELPTPSRVNNEQRRSGGRSKEYWQHDDRTNDTRKEERVPQGRPLHGIGRSASRGNKEKESPLPQDESNWD